MSDQDTDDIPSSDSDEALEWLIEHCESKNLKFTVCRENKRINFKLNRPHTYYDISLRLTNDDEILHIDIVYPFLANDEKMRPALIEFFTRANYGLVLGGFQIDHRDGETFYHMGYLIPDGGLTDEGVTRMVSNAIAICDRYFSGAMRTLFAGETPQDAIYLCELDYQTTDDEEVTKTPPSEIQNAAPQQLKDREQSDISESDELLIARCLQLIAVEKRAARSLLQRRLKLGYTRAVRVMEILEQRGIVGPKNADNDHEILVDLTAFLPEENPKAKKTPKKSSKKKNSP